MAAARIALALMLLLLGATATRAQTERVTDVVSDVKIRPDGRLDVTETITFRVLGTQIRHGIKRDFPTDYRGLSGSRSTTGFVPEDVRLDSESVPTQLSRLKNGVLFASATRIGSFPPAFTPTRSAT
jgi:hypothetical protein